MTLGPTTILVYPYPMVLIAVLAMGWQRPPADSVLKSAVSRLQKLKSLSMKVLHHADFMADTKDSTDTIAWLAPRKFEIVSNKDSIPKLSCDGKKLTTYIPQVTPISEGLNMEFGRTKSWESRGGIVLSILMRGPLVDQWLHPDKVIKTTFEYGKTLHWHDAEVSEIIETMSVRGSVVKISYYLSANHEHFVGTEVSAGPESSWTQFSDWVENPPLRATLGSIGSHER